MVPSLNWYSESPPCCVVHLEISLSGTTKRGANMLGAGWSVIKEGCIRERHSLSCAFSTYLCAHRGPGKAARDDNFLINSQQTPTRARIHQHIHLMIRTIGIWNLTALFKLTIQWHSLMTLFTTDVCCSGRSNSIQLPYKDANTRQINEWRYFHFDMFSLVVLCTLHSFTSN